MATTSREDGRRHFGLHRSLLVYSSILDLEVILITKIIMASLNQLVVLWFFFVGNFLQSDNKRK